MSDFSRLATTSSEFKNDQEIITDWLLSKSYGSRESYFGIIRRIYGYSKKAGLNSQISAHWLRHQRASDLANSNKFTLFQVMEFMRHSSPQITAKYIHTDVKIGSDALL